MTGASPSSPACLGAALFGVGWGLVGLCPGPALVDLVAGGADVGLFVAAMLAGMAAFAALRHDDPRQRP